MMLWLLLAHLAHAQSEVFDRVVAEVQQQLVLASEVQLESDLVSRDRSALPFFTDAHADPLTRLIDAAVLRAAAGDVGLYQPTDEEVQARLEEVRSTFVDRTSWEAFLTLHGLDERALGRVLRRRLVAERYLRRNLSADPADAATWLSECDGLLSQLRGRVRVRRIPLLGGP
jgi:hypothetical protein